MWYWLNTHLQITGFTEDEIVPYTAHAHIKDWVVLPGPLGGITPKNRLYATKEAAEKARAERIPVKFEEYDTVAIGKLPNGDLLVTLTSCGWELLCDHCTNLADVLQGGVEPQWSDRYYTLLYELFEFMNCNGWWCGTGEDANMMTEAWIMTDDGDLDDRSLEDEIYDPPRYCWHNMGWYMLRTELEELITKGYMVLTRESLS